MLRRDLWTLRVNFSSSPTRKSRLNSHSKRDMLFGPSIFVSNRAVLSSWGPQTQEKRENVRIHSDVRFVNVVIVFHYFYSPLIDNDFVINCRLVDTTDLDRID